MTQQLRTCIKYAFFKIANRITVGNDLEHSWNDDEYHTNEKHNQVQKQ